MSSQILKKSLQIVEDKPSKDAKKKKTNTKAKQRTKNEGKSVEENLKKLLAMSSDVSSSKKKPDFEKMFHNARQGTRAKKQVLEEKAAQEAAEGNSVFSKEDFLRFERELFCDK